MKAKTNLQRFKSLAKEGKAQAATPLLSKAAVSTVSGVQDRTVRFVISTAGVDRDLDTVALEGWDLTAYRRNPVVLWGHDADELPIGKCTEIGVSDGALRAAVEFVPADMPVVGDRAEAVLRMCRDGFLSATSVGFRPLEWKITEDPERGAEDWMPGFDFLRQELMEFSIVSIPANPEALMEEPGASDVRLAARGEAVKSILDGVRNSLSRKGMYDVSCLASLLSELGWLHDSVSWEAEHEGDGSTLPAQLGEALRILGEALVAMSAEEVAEMLADAAQQQQRAAVAAARKQRQLDARLIALG
ncbi:MAG TPA: HK97 family phage prohead protease [Roseomonas sp.]|nr:HK97 family phage prohead protease [Roseomonas sp.]